MEMDYQLLLESATGETDGLCENVELVNAMARYHHIDGEPGASSGRASESRNPVDSTNSVANIRTSVLTQD